MADTAAVAARESVTTRRAPKTRKPNSLENARGELRRLLQARIAAGEQELQALRAELLSIGGETSERKRQVCSGCHKPGHTRRTCPERASVQHGFQPV